jgi:hypothetical protein
MPDQKRPKAKEDMKSFKDEIIHHFHIVSENLMDQVKQVAEGVSNVNEKLERFRVEITEDVANNHQALSLAITKVDEKVERFREELKAEIQGVKQELKAETQGVRQELKTEIQDVNKLDQIKG